ncbi:MAG: alpha-galactosidase, partial [Bacteroidales bacterium]|nr:alpha-galactosidase [Bacteroidales bacterium]
DLPSNDSFTLSLLTNEEVLKMHRESTNVRQLYQEDGKVAVTSENKHNGDVYLALFNISDDELPESVSIDLNDINIDEECTVIDIWSGESLGKFSDTFSQELAAHASGLFLIRK